VSSAWSAHAAAATTQLLCILNIENPLNFQCPVRSVGLPPCLFSGAAGVTGACESADTSERLRKWFGARCPPCTATPQHCVGTRCGLMYVVRLDVAL
jgi:hypothetical protein